MSKLRKLFSGSSDHQDIFQQYNRICLVPRWLGFCPVIFKQDTFLVSFKLLIFTFSFVFLAIFFGCYSTMELDFSPNQHFYRFLYIVKSTCYILSPLLILFPLGKLTQLNKFLSNISLVDQNMKKLGYIIDTHRSRESRIGCWFHWFNFLAIITLILSIVPNELLFWVSCLHFPNFIIIIILDHMTSTLAVLRSRLDAVITVANNVPCSSDMLKILEELVRCHHLLCKSGSQLNKVYSVNFLLLCASSFATAVCELYYLYYYLLLSQFDLIIMLKLCWVLMGGITLWRLVTSCAVTCVKAKEFNTLLYQLMTEDKTNEMLHNQKLRLHITIKHDIVFSASGFFIMDYTLFQSMIATATTYLVILIHFGQPPHSEMSTLKMNNITTIPMSISKTY